MEMHVLTFAIGHIGVRFLVNIRKPEEEFGKRTKSLWIAANENARTTFGDFQIPHYS